MSEQTASPLPEPTDAILTIPNLLTFLRLALVPVVAWVALGPDRIDIALILALAGFATDLIDGMVARRYGQISKLGIALDPLADRLGLALGMVIFVVHDLAPLWIVIAVAARDGLLVLIGAPVMKILRMPIPPVSAVGKAGSFIVSVAFALLLGSGWPGPDDQIQVLRTIGSITAVVGLPLYYAAAAGYVRAGIDAMRRRTTEGGRSVAG